MIVQDSVIIPISDKKELSNAVSRDFGSFLSSNKPTYCKTELID